MRDKKDPYEIEDRRVLTFVEHRLIGSGTNRRDMRREPFKPLAVLEGEKPIDVAQRRIKQREIVSADHEAFGLPLGRFPVVALNMISNKTGEVLNSQLRLTGILDEDADEPERDPEVLAQYSMTPEGRKKYFTEALSGHREKVG